MVEVLVKLLIGSRLQCILVPKLIQAAVQIYKAVNMTQTGRLGDRGFALTGERHAAGRLNGKLVRVLGYENEMARYPSRIVWKKPELNDDERTQNKAGSTGPLFQGIQIRPRLPRKP